MQIITLTTDMGLRDHYVASMKGKILSHSSDVQIVDISHNVKAFDCIETALILKNCFEDFPEGTIHIIGVDSEPVYDFNSNEGHYPTIMKYKGQYFVGCDNGLYSIILGEDTFEKLWRIDDALSNPKLFKFFAKDVLVPAAMRIANNENIDDFASEHEAVKRVLVPLPTIEPNILKGHVTSIDSYGNIITNITEELFNKMGGKTAPFIIYLKKREHYIDKISTSYNSVISGEKVAIFNSNNVLEIAINRAATNRTGGANALFGINVNDIIRIDFQPAGSKNTLDELF